jgi:threonine dehydrogenase-like Zn-dependent dehydrogenase
VAVASAVLRASSMASAANVAAPTRSALTNMASHLGTGLDGATVCVPCAGSAATMRAAVYHEFGGPIVIEEVPMPLAPAGGVVIEVRATGVCRSDWHGWSGHDSDIESFIPGAFTPGHELSGVVTSLGAGVSKFAIGERVAVPFILSCGECRECARSKPTVCEDQAQPGFTLQVMISSSHGIDDVIISSHGSDHLMAVMTLSSDLMRMAVVTLSSVMAVMK